MALEAMPPRPPPHPAGSASSSSPRRPKSARRPPFPTPRPPLREMDGDGRAISTPAACSFPNSGERNDRRSSRRGFGGLVADLGSAEASSSSASRPAWSSCSSPRASSSLLGLDSSPPAWRRSSRLLAGARRGGRPAAAGARRREGGARRWAGSRCDARRRVIRRSRGADDGGGLLPPSPALLPPLSFPLRACRRGSWGGMRAPYLWRMAFFSGTASVTGGVLQLPGLHGVPRCGCFSAKSHGKRPTWPLPGLLAAPVWTASWCWDADEKDLPKLTWVFSLRPLRQIPGRMAGNTTESYGEDIACERGWASRSPDERHPSAPWCNHTI
ncbi:unnamed protein product [Urochloa humidicola]